MDTSESVIWALAICIFVAIPVASQNLPDEDFENVVSEASEEDQPVEVTTRLTSDYYLEKVESAFEHRMTNITGNKREEVVEKPEGRLEIIEKPGERTQKFETSEGLYKKVESSTEDRETIKSPQGTLEKVKENGTVEESFEGTDMEALKDLNETLRDGMSDFMVDVDEGFQLQEASQIDIYVQPDTSVDNGEYVRLRNDGSEAVDLDGWRIEDSYYSPYYFTNETLQPDESVYVYTDNPGAEHDRNRSAVWSQDGDTARLYDEDGGLVEEYSY